MKIVLIAACRGDKPLEKIVGYGQVLPWWIAHALRQRGHDASLWWEGDLGKEMPRSDVVVVVGSQALVKLRRDADLMGVVERSTERVCEMSDGPVRSIFDWGCSKYAGAYFGMGADPGHIYPAQAECPRVVLFNGWNLPLDNPAHKDPLYEPALEALQAAKREGWAVWSLNAPIPWADRVIGSEVPGRARTRYIPWVDYCELMRQGSIFFDTTNKVVELGRIEAAVAGNVLVAPRYNQTCEEWLDGVRYLHQVPFDESDAVDAMLRAIRLARDTDPGQIATTAMEYFAWPLVAERIDGFLAIPRREMGQHTRNRPGLVKCIDGEEWTEVEQDVPAEVAAGPARPKEAPWVEYPIRVPPALLHWQDGDRGPRPLEESAHARGARQILQGWPPDGTDYARAVTDQQAGCHGKPSAFAELVRGMKRDGWEGKPIIGWINRRGEVVIHDGWHRSAAAWACELDHVPVAVHGRDEDWIAFRHSVVKLNGGRKLYQPIAHPDFGWHCWRKDTARRIALISRWLTDEGATTVCDLGCHSGAISHGLTRAGLSVVGIDQNEQAVKVARMGAGMTYFGGGDRVGFVVGSEPTRADAVVCLSAINHALVTDQAKADALLAIIRERAHLLVTDCPTPGDPVGGDTEWADPTRMCSWLEAAGWSVALTHQRGADLQRTLIYCRRT